MTDKENSFLWCFVWCLVVFFIISVDRGVCVLFWTVSSPYLQLVQNVEIQTQFSTNSSKLGKWCQMLVKLEQSKAKILPNLAPLTLLSDTLSVWICLI